jgi:hypothetical protein
MEDIALIISIISLSISVLMFFMWVRIVNERYRVCESKLRLEMEQELHERLMREQEAAYRSKPTSDI